MPEHRNEPHHHSPFSLKDILFALFKHKRKIALFTAVGFIAGAVVYFFFPPTYQSQAKLLVRYVLERSSVDPIENTTRPNQSGKKTTDSVISSEVEILTSWDLAVQVAKTIGPKRLLPAAGDAATESRAAATVAGGLEATTRKGSDIIFLSYKNRDPEVATLVLSELVNRYFTKHLEVHRSAGAFDFVTQQTDQIRARLNQTEDGLKTIRAKYGVTSLKGTTDALNAELTRTQEQLRDSESEAVEQRARIKQTGGPASRSSANSEATGGEGRSTNDSEAEGPEIIVPRQANEATVQEYQALVTRLSELRKTEADLRGKYTESNPLLISNRLQIDDAQKRRQDFEKNFPDLPSRIRTTNSRNQNEPVSDSARLAGIEAKVEALKARTRDVQERIKQLGDVAPQMADLERRKELEETNYKYFQATLEKARVDEALDPSKMPNISAVQKPSPPILVTALRDKIAGGLAAGGALVGILFALLNELLLKQTIKRPLELIGRIGVPPLVAIPYQSPKALPRPVKKRRKKKEVAVVNGAHPNQAPWEEGHFIRPYSEAMRDRISLYFERHGMTHKPKLLGVTSFSKGAGTSTIAAGLAAALSEMRDGKVLLVDVNVGHAQAHPFFGGRPAPPLNTLLTPGSPDVPTAADNLYLATVGPTDDGPVQRALKKFFSMMPTMKASDFDYIIFDMPPLGQTTPTLGMAEYMDKVLVIVEAEKTNRDAVKRGYEELAAGRSSVSIVINKVRSYLPKWVEDEV